MLLIGEFPLLKFVYRCGAKCVCVGPNTGTTSTLKNSKRGLRSNNNSSSSSIMLSRGIVALLLGRVSNRRRRRLRLREGSVWFYVLRWLYAWLLEYTELCFDWLILC